MLKRLVSRLFNSLHLIYVEKKKKRMHPFIPSPKFNTDEMERNTNDISPSIYYISEGTADYSYFNISSVRYLHTLVTISPMIPNGNILSETNAQSKIIFLLFFISEKKKKVSTLKPFKLILHKISLNAIV